MTGRTVLHIGGAKTASTTLQTAVLLQASTIHHFGEGGDGVTGPDDERIIRSLLNDDAYLCDYSEVESLFRRHRKLAGGATFVFSSADVLLANQPTVAAARLRALLGADTDVLLVVRNQLSALLSLYSGHGAWLKPAPAPYFRHFVSFQNWLELQWLDPSTSALASFAYWEQLQPFIAAFGREQVKVVPFERLVLGDKQTWATVADLLGLESQLAWQLFSADRRRERISLWQKRYGHVASVLRPFSSVPDIRRTGGPLTSLLARGPRFVPKWPTGMETRIRTHYGPGNSVLNGEFALGLAEFGYPMGSK